MARPTHRTTAATAIVAALALAVVPAAGQAARPPARQMLLPDRTLDCMLGRAINIDRMKDQKASDIITEGRHSFAFRLPAIAKRAGPAPDPADPPDPVDPRTRVTADPDGIARAMAPRFDRVVDLWPERVELLAAIPGESWSQLIILNPIDAGQGVARLFMTRVKDAATLDLARVYVGECRVRGTSAGRAAG